MVVVILSCRCLTGLLRLLGASWSDLFYYLDIVGRTTVVSLFYIVTIDFVCLIVKLVCILVHGCVACEGLSRVM